MSTTVDAPPQGTDDEPLFVEPLALPSRGAAALCGVVAAGGAIVAGELLASVASSVPSPVASVGRVVIDLAPKGVREAAIGALGRTDKPALVVGTMVLAVLIGGGFGVLGRSRRTIAMSGLAAFGAAGLIAAQSDPRATLLGGAIGASVGIAVGVGLLWLLLDRASTAAEGAATLARAPRPKMAQAQRAASLQRRGFLRDLGLAAGGVVAGGAVVATRGLGGGGGGPVPTGSAAAPGAPGDLSLPPVPEPLPPVPASATFDDVVGLSRMVTPNDEFYRIDTAIIIPKVDATTWSMRIEGMVDRPFELTYQDLRALPQIERDVTLSCVSNEVGGDLVGTARFQGVLLKPLLERAGLQRGAEQVMGYSVDGFTAGFPIEAALDDREAMIAIGMNGEPLPRMHGYPARLVVPGLYGYVSATKWLSKIKLTTMSANGYWIPRGWSKLGPIKTECRIDVPAKTHQVPGKIVIAGVAWAPTRGISKVEVQIDDGPWQEAKLAPGLGKRTWTQWSYVWDAPLGKHTMRARATDGTGETQTADVADVAPNGATGYPSRRVTVE